MKKYWKEGVIVVVLGLLAALLLLRSGDLLTFEKVKENSTLLRDYVSSHYLLSLLLFAVAFLSTAFAVPGALVLTVSGGFLFGTIPGAVYATIFSTIGSLLAFFASRHLIGRWIQNRYEKKLDRFNKEMNAYGPNYLFVVRIIPVMPAFLINYLSGLTPISPVRFTFATFLGIFPGAIVYSLAGSEMQHIQNPGDVLSGRVLIAFLLLALFALVPVILKKVKQARARRRERGE
jgi:uncharacterized membrane protein YdjX (TVP38/TMEM64 family)